jgi:flagellar basal-body rod protein FlgB
MFEVSPVLELLSRALDNAALRQAVHTTNIANADTPGFHRLGVTFDTQLRAAADAPTEAAAEWTSTRPRTVATGDTVRLDQEMALMAKDALRYQALLGAVDRTFGLLSVAIHEGKES